MKLLASIMIQGLAVFLAMFVAGCGTVQKADPLLTGVTAEVAVIHHCLKDAPAEPEAYADKDLPLGPSLGPTRFKLTSAANDQREAFLALIRPYLQACR